MWLQNQEHHNECTHDHQLKVRHDVRGPTKHVYAHHFEPDWQEDQERGTGKATKYAAQTADDNHKQHKE